MVCKNCGEKNKENLKYCTKCGSTLEEPNETLGVISLILGIVSLILSFIVNIIILPLAFLGLILGIINKANKGKKISGIVLNIIAMFISVVVFFLIFIFGIMHIDFFFDKYINSGYLENKINKIENIFDRETSSNYVQGYYNCKSFSGRGESEDYIVRFELKRNTTFLWADYNNVKTNYVRGFYSYRDLYKTNNSGDYTYYQINIKGDEYVSDGIKQSEEYESEYEFGITKQNGKKQGILMNTKTQNMYYCYEE